MWTFVGACQEAEFNSYAYDHENGSHLECLELKTHNLVQFQLLHQSVPYMHTVSREDREWPQEEIEALALAWANAAIDA
jgi:hypothetical protein